jgi:hypothetical protein
MHKNIIYVRPMRRRPIGRRFIMAKTFGKLNKSNKMNNVVNNGMVITKGQETFRAEELLNGTITKESFLKMGKIELPAAIKANPLMVLALSYDQDSKVGIWTNKAMNICTALPSEFLNKDGKGANKQFNRAFINAGKGNGSNKHYERIFNTDLNISIFNLVADPDFKVEAYYVSNKEINMFDKALRNLDLAELNLIDVMNIQADLWFLFRAWQESSIDMVKDKAKQFAKGMDEILGALQVRTGVSFTDILTNEYSLKSAKYNKEIKTEDLPVINIDFAEYDDEDEDGMFCETTLSEMQHQIRLTAEEELQVIADGFMNSDITKYEVYNRAAQDYPELAMSVMDLFKVIKDYNNVSREEKQAGKKLISKDYALLRAILYNDAKELDVDITEVAQVVLGVAGSAGVYSYVNKDGEEVIVVKEFDAKTMSKQLYAAELLLNNIVVLEKGILYNSPMIYDEQYIMTEVEPHHIFEDVENGVYNFVDGKAYDGETLLFDTNTEYDGEVVVNDNGVFYLYDPLCEVENIPAINAVFTDEIIEDDEVPEHQVGVALEAALKALVAEQGVYSIEGDVIYVNGLDVAAVDAGYAVDNEEVVEAQLTKFYGIGGNRFNGETELRRNHKFLLLNYNDAEVEDYINNITQYC